LPATLGVLFALWGQSRRLVPARAGRVALWLIGELIERGVGLLPAGRGRPAEAGWPPASLALALAVA